MIENAIRAARLDLDFYNTVEADESFNGQAALLVLIVSALSGIGVGLTPGTPFFRSIIITTIGGLIAWVLWAALTAWIGRSVFGGTTNFGEMLRVLGYAQAPRAIGVLPFIGWIGFVWALVASVVAIREGHDFTTGKAIATAILGWIALIVVSWFLPFV
jgi:hypothetical protein